MDKLLHIHPADNVRVLREPLAAGEAVVIDGQTVLSAVPLGLGHKVAARFIRKGEQVIKFGVPIGSATEDIPMGTHVHLHNLKSDYLPTYTLTDEYIAKK